MNTFRINSNPASALAYRNLSKTQSGLQTTLERLSSGLHINKAADDSAGSTISTRMSNQIRGMKQANENAQQANNLIQTAENGLHDISDMLSRMRELAVQASTDTLNNTDRASSDLEYQALKNEITRIANVIQYNEMDILNGTDYRNQVNADNSTADDVAGVSINNLSNDIRKGAYTLSDEVISVSGQADISNLPSANVRYDVSAQSGSYTLNAVETTSADYALQFDGTSDYVNIDGVSSSFSDDDAFTISLWIKTDGTTESGIQKSIAFSMHSPESTNVIRFSIDRTSGGAGLFYADSNTANQTISSINYNDQQWHHIVVTRPSGSGSQTGTFYADGSNVGIVSTLDPNLTSVSKVSIGQEWDTYATDFWGGYIDEVAVWNKALTNGEISALYNSGSGLDASSDSVNYASSSSLQGYWNFNGDSGGYGNRSQRK